jgi:hypothetical protein
MSIRRSIVSVTVALVALLGLGAGSAFASYEQIAKFPTEGIAMGVAVDQSLHVLYVATYQGELFKFNEKGEPQEFVATKSDAVTLSGTEVLFPQVVVDNSSSTSKHAIYVTLSTRNEVLALNEKGEITNRIKGVEEPRGVAVNGAGDVFVSQWGEGGVLEFSPTGEPLNGGKPVVEGLTHPSSLAFNSAGDLYAAEEEKALVEFVANGHGGFEPAKTIGTTTAEDVTIDQETNDVFMGETVAKVQEFSEAGAKIGETFKGGEGAIAVNETSNVLYFASGAAEVRVFAPAVPKQPLTVEVEGHGKVTGGAISCETTGAGSDQGTCSAQEAEGAEVVLKDTPESGWAFSKWEGCESEPAAGECKVKVSKAQSVKALNTELHGFPLSVSVTGAGKVNGAGISECTSAGGAGCVTVAEGTATLTATAAPEYVLAGWLGCKKASADTCEVTVTAASEVTAVFLKEGKEGTTGKEGKTGPMGPAGNEGKVGAAGNEGHEGKPGSPGEKGSGGTSGTNGTQGPAGAQGPAGPAGPAGKEGPAGTVQLVTCTKAGKKKKCTTKTVSGTVKFTTSSMQATLSRHGLVYATGAAHAGTRGALSLRLSDRRALRPGRYTLTLISGAGRDERISTEAFTLS